MADIGSNCQARLEPDSLPPAFSNSCVNSGPVVSRVVDRETIARVVRERGMLQPVATPSNCHMKHEATLRRLGAMLSHCFQPELVDIT
jgi:hypothetical protein